MKDAQNRPLADLPFTLTALRNAYARGVTARAVMAECLARLADVGDPGIFIHLPPEADLMEAADALGPFDPDLPLWGVPFAVKDNIDVAGMPTSAACPAWSYAPKADAFVVARLRAAGAIPLGKTNLDQFATGLVGVRTPYGAPRNALDPDIVPGGSSGGSGVIVGHGIVPFALGTDTAGSGRVPAALNGITGLKPTLGALSASGVVPACRTLDTVSIFARYVADAHAVFTVAAGVDPADAYSRPVPAPPLPAPLPAPRIAIPDATSIVFLGDTVQRDAFAATVAALKDAGAIVTEIDFTPFYDVARMLYDGAWVAERHSVIEALMREDPDAILPVTRGIVGNAETLSATDAFRGFYRLAELRAACAPVLAGCDMLCVPTIPTFYTVADLEADPVTPNSNLGTYTNFVNLMDLAAIAVPAAPRADGRPGSVTLIGPAGSDGRLAAEALRIEALATGTPPPAPVAQPGADEIALAVCGAHMSGLPLNGQLTGRAGRFLAATRTSEDYGFYALPGGPPERPGLVRLGEGGQSIAVEVWALPKSAIGGLLAEIPAPLGLGPVRLEDGSSVPGFLCEAAATDGATDIGTFGGWRAYLAAKAAPITQ
ncbi:allophanate hydrolase [Meridianimarinicoccus roseus]|uniref:Allophanate hydrolase n=1 Tax=Meridianimarinicoccus roseus TaxID=2072018 RepID=A0A2V2LFL0_9RHOB|nr:allophanate hydrolase [Meridianimarinicoccus roseus]PWR02691.1 allophanate hydrolase [Meridianimarinicoccus roseus]